MYTKINNIKWNFTDKKVLVVGASRGIGKGVADAFSSSGAEVFEISSHNCDISSKEQIDQYTSNLDRIDILINVAAINFAKNIEQISIEEWDAVMSVNLRGIFYITKKIIPKMPSGSKIINVSSIAGRHRSLVSGIHYVSSKAGLIGFTKQLAFELSNKNINVNVVCPSQTLTDMLQSTTSPEELSQLEKNIPIGRIATVEEQVAPILFLASSEASYMTGCALDINGGQF